MNLLVFLTDGQQAETVAPGHDCQTPNIDKLAARGVRFSRAHTVCPTCSPARASLMTGLLPHNHGVLEVEHGRDADQCVLRTEKPHWAQRLQEAGYHTGYFGKWHIERTHDLSEFGWQEHVCKGAEHVKDLGKGSAGPSKIEVDPASARYLEGPEGYNRVLHYGVTDAEPQDGYLGVTFSQVEQFLTGAMGRSQPWCCCVSYSEPNEALVVSRRVYDQYNVDALQLPPNWNDDLSDRPAIYRRQRQISRNLDEHTWRQARACYYGRVTELDEQFGRLMNLIESAGAMDDTLVVFLSDHGRYVGAHGFDAHNFGALEEIYRIPLIVAGPGVAAGAVSESLVGIHDVCPTLLELAGAEPIDVADSASFARSLKQPAKVSSPFDWGYAEYHGTRFPLMQRVCWHENWKLVFNGFDFDELYNLEADPYEMHNLAADPAHAERRIAQDVRRRHLQA